tara:strand:- start:35 stop:568 length:534 start_codon:yes stop_codon:yes gene_type:complete
MNEEKTLDLLKNEETNLEILKKLVQESDPKIITQMIELFDNSRIEVRGEVFSTLLQNENDILEQLINGLKNESKNVRAYTTLVLANRFERKAIPNIENLTNDQSGLVRTCAFGALGHFEEKNAKQKLHDGIFDSNIEAVKSALYSLSRICEKLSEKELEIIKKYDDPDFKKILKFFN